MSRNIITLLAVVTLSILVGYFLNKIPKNQKQVIFNNPVSKDETSENKRKWIIKEIKIGDKNYQIFVTENEEDRKKGLSVFNELESNQGMLFEFPEENYHSFWMKDMKFDIDIIFLDRDMKVIGIFENVQKSSYKNDTDFKTYMPKLKSNYVIEIKSGEVKKNKIKNGDVVNIKYNK